MPCFQAHEWTPPSSSPPVGESSFAMCHISELSNPLLPLPPLQSVRPSIVPPFLPLQPAPPSSSLPSSEPPFSSLHRLPATSAVQVAYAACIHRCRMWFSRRALPRNPW